MDDSHSFLEKTIVHEIIKSIESKTGTSSLLKDSFCSPVSEGNFTDIIRRRVVEQLLVALPSLDRYHKAASVLSHYNLKRKQHGFIMEVIRSQRSNNDRSTTE